MLGLFDPSNLELYLDANLEADEERALLRDCRINEAAEIARRKAAAMTDTQRFDYAMKATSELHELRHVHDYFGTTWGHERFIRTVGDAAEFHRMWTALDGVATIELPLRTWGTSRDAPAALVEYLEQRDEFVAWARSQQGDLQSVSVSKESAIPTFEMTFRNGRTQEVSGRMIPLGSDALMEGSALIVQRLALDHIFQDDSASKLGDMMAGGTVADDRWTVYIAVDRYLSKKLVRFQPRYQTALADLALMAPYDEAPERRHPGVRLGLATEAAASLGADAHRDPDRDLAEYQETIAAKCGWPSPRAVVEKRVTVLRAQLAALDEKESRVGSNVSVWDRLVRAADRAHLESLEHRHHVPELFANPSTYLQASCILPPAPMRIEQQHTVFRGIGPADTGKENAGAFRQWYLLEYIVNRLLFTTTLPCPIAREPHECAGDPLSRSWKPNDACPFSRMVVELDIPNRRFTIPS